MRAKCLAEVIVRGEGESGVQVEAVARDGVVEERSGALGRVSVFDDVVLDVLDGSALRGDLREQVGE